MAFKGAMVLSEKDNVATCIQDVKAGASVEIRHDEKVWQITAQEDIPFGFKIAIAAIAEGDHIKKYGESIGIASSDIAAGDMVHIHNLEGARGRGDLEKEGAQ